VATALTIDQHLKSITARDTPGWMHDDCVTRRRAFWVQGFLYAQGAKVLMIEPSLQVRLLRV
jgi:hypothetical protein